MRSVIEIAQSVRSGRDTAVSVLEEFVDRIEQGNPRLNAFFYLDFKSALDAAKVIDQRCGSDETS